MEQNLGEWDFQRKSPYDYLSSCSRNYFGKKYCLIKSFGNIFIFRGKGDCFELLGILNFSEWNSGTGSRWWLVQHCGWAQYHWTVDLKWSILWDWHIHTYCSVIKSCPTLYDPMDCSTPGFPVLQYLPEFAQTHVHWIGDAIQPSHSLLHPSPSALNLSQHRGIFNTYATIYKIDN